jgi:hypothetical protein
MEEPRDGYWVTGCLVLGLWEEVHPATLRQHALGWLVKGFFLPLMFVDLVDDAGWFIRVPLDIAGRDAMSCYDFAFRLLYMIDLIPAPMVQQGLGHMLRAELPVQRKRTLPTGEVTSGKSSESSIADGCAEHLQPWLPRPRLRRIPSPAHEPRGDAERLREKASHAPPPIRQRPLAFER